MKPKDYLEWLHGTKKFKHNYRLIKEFQPDSYKKLTKKGKFKIDLGNCKVLDFKLRKLNE